MFLAVRGASGLHLVDRTPEWKVHPGFQPDTSKNCKCMVFSVDGKYLAWCNGDALIVAAVEADSSWTVKWKTDEVKRAVSMEFSPKGNYISTWEVFAVRTGETTGFPNLKIWSVESGKVVKEFVQRKFEGWAPQWSNDEVLCCIRSPNNEAFFFSNCDFSGPTSRLSLAKMSSFSMAPVGVSAEKTHHIVAFVPGQKGGPGLSKLFAHPHFNPEINVLASKSFFNVDKMDAEWSCDGRSVILLCQAEVDKTGASYYGKTQLVFVDVKGESMVIHLPKEGPIYHTCWSPTKPEFCIVYGYMPAKATIFNKKCEPVFDFGTGPRNIAMFNPQGTILMLAGFGNLRGSIEMWDIEKKKDICKFEAPDSTDAKWSPDGQYLVTSTCAPRLRQSNGYKIWHYSSTLMHETSLDDKSELWEVKWQSVEPESCKPFTITNKPIAGGVQSAKPVASKQAYRPPGARGIVSNFKLHDEDELPQNKKKESGSDSLSKSALKNKKRRDKKKDGDAAPEAVNASASESSNAKIEIEMKSNGQDVSNDPEVAKQMKKLNDKLSQITKLKAMQAEGKKLELNQLEKIKSEKEMIDKLRSLRLQSK